MHEHALPVVQLSPAAGAVELRWGQPDRALLPAEGLRAAADAVLREDGRAALSYGANAGPGPLLAWIAERLGVTDARAPEPDEVLVTAGTSSALDRVAGLLARPGDAVLVEQPTYDLALRILGERGLRPVPVAVDGDGLDPAAVAAALARGRAAGSPPRLLYTVPTFHNPTGATLAGDRRRALVDLAAREGLWIVEDDAYRELAYDGPPPPSLWSLDGGERVVRLGTFTKSLAPGLRVGWVTGPRAVLAALRDSGLRMSAGGPSHFAAMVAARFCRDGAFAAHVEALRAELAARRDALCDALAGVEGARFARPGGGYFVWLALPPGVTGAAVADRGRALGVDGALGTRFCVEGGEGALRLAFSLYPAERLTEGARRLAEAVATAVPALAARAR